MLQYKSSICEKSCSWDIDWNALNQSDCMIFKSEQIDKTASFLHVDTNLQKLKVDPKFISWALSGIGVANLVSRL